MRKLFLLTAIVMSWGTFASARQFKQEPVAATNNLLDVAIQGDGFLRVVKDGGVAYTRFGALMINYRNQVLVGLGDGYRLDPPLMLPSGTKADQINIYESGL